MEVRSDDIEVKSEIHFCSGWISGKYHRTPTFGHHGVVSLVRINEPDQDPIAAFLCFTVTIRTAGLSVPPYSDYQQFLHDKITELREQGLEFEQIAEWLRENGYKTTRGKRFYRALGS